MGMSCYKVEAAKIATFRDGGNRLTKRSAHFGVKMAKIRTIAILRASHGIQTLSVVALILDAKADIWIISKIQAHLFRARS